MIQAQLILAGNQAERLSKADKIINQILGPSAREKGHPDLIIPQNGPSLGISQIRNLQKRLALKPYSAPLKIALLPEAEKLTLPAQNALLKTLEEPPENTLIILLAPKKENFLPTIVSRCQLTQLTQKPEKEINQKDWQAQAEEIVSLLKSGVGERLKRSQSFRTRQEASRLTQNLLYFWREMLLLKTGVKKVKSHQELKKLNVNQISAALEKTETTRKLLEANVNPLLGIEALFLAYPQLSED